MSNRSIQSIAKAICGILISGLLFITASTITPAVAQSATPTLSGSNVALGKSAAQSSTLNDKPASYAVDGNTDGAIANNSVSSTQMNAQAWWQVDLGAVYNLTDIRVWNRTDSGMESRLSNFYVLVSNVPFTSTDLTTTRNQAGVGSYPVNGTAGRPDTISVNRSGRYVRVQLVGTDFLNLAEVEVFVSGQGPTPTATLTPTITPTATMTPYPAPVNVALGKTANQSSIYENAFAGLAIDGITDGNYFNGSVSHTNSDSQAWWQVDLGAIYTITDIKIWNRTDGSQSRLSNFYILISDTPFTSTDLNFTKNQPGVSNYYISGTAGSPSIVNANRTGRYVRVQLSATNCLHMAEVQVLSTGLAPAPTATFTTTRTPTITPTTTPTRTLAPLPTPFNIAVGKTASQSSTYGNASAGLAVDGNTDGNYNNGSVNHTNSASQAWWQVDLGAVYTLTDIKIWNRTDAVPERLSNFYILVSDVPFISADLNTARNQYGVTSYYVSGTAGTPTIVNANRSGRYVRVQLTVTNCLHMAEVQVYSNGIKDVAIGASASQSSTYGSAVAGLAVDGNTDGNYYNGSVNHTNSDSQAWWQVDLGAVYTITDIKIWNRTDGSQSRLSDFYLLVSDTPFSSADLNTAKSQTGVSNYYISGVAGLPSIVSANRTGRYVRIQLTTTNFLHMAEVQIFSPGLAP